MGQLKYNTVYQSLKKVSAEWHGGAVQWSYYYNYIKFYSDGTFLYVASSDDIESLKDWFTLDKFSGAKGSFSVKDNQIDATIPAAIGILNLDGCVYENKLILRGINKETNLFEYWDEYKAI